MATASNVDAFTREYIKVTPSKNPLEARTIVQQLAGLHSITTGTQSLAERANPFTRQASPTFEFIALTEGAESPVEFYYGADKRLDALEQQLRSLYPATFDIERVRVNLLAKLLPAVRYDREAFTEQCAADAVFEPDQAVLAPETDEAPADLDEDPDEDLSEDRLEDIDVEDRSIAPPGDEARSDLNPGPPADESLDFDEDPLVDEPWSDGGVREAAHAPAGRHRPPDSTASAVPETARDLPRELDAETVLARPALDAVDPLGVSWYGTASRPKNWMTSLPRFTEYATDGEETRFPLTPAIDLLARSDHPLAFQVVCRRKPDWTDAAQERRHDLRDGLDTIFDRLFAVLFDQHDRRKREPSSRGHERRYMDVDGKRIAESIEEKDAHQTFVANVRALSLVTDDTRDPVSRTLEDLRGTFDHLRGDFYHVTSRRFHRRLFRSRNARRARDHVLQPTLVTAGRLGRFQSRRPELVLDPDELANFLVVPPATDLTLEGGRTAQAQQASQTPLPRPPTDQLERYREGIALGRALDQDRNADHEATRLPPELLVFHLARIAMTGAGKTVALINDLLSLYEVTDGPIFVLDTKGGGLAEHYIRAHAKHFGFDDLEENVLYFDVPDILPGIAFYDIREAINRGVKREQAVQHTAHYYQEIAQLVMGKERYQRAVAAPNVITYLIKAMYDEEHGLANGRYRASTDFFGHSQLEQAVVQYREAGPPDRTRWQAPQLSDETEQEKLHQHLEADTATFAKIVSGVSNRLDPITSDTYLRQLFDNTEPTFSFREVLDEHRVVILDLGDLREDPTTVMAGLLLTMLFDAVRDRDSMDLASRPDEDMVNVVIDEAATVAGSGVLQTLLSQGQEFGVALELATQFPEQFELKGDEESYQNVLSNVGTLLVGKQRVTDDDLAAALAHEDMTPAEFRNRAKTLPRGEWIAQLAGPFGEPGPLPFTMAPLSIPAGHPESDEPLTSWEEQWFDEALTTIRERTHQEYGVPETVAESVEEVSREAQELLGLSSGRLDVAVAKAVRCVQFQAEEREANGFVGVAAVDELLLSVCDHVGLTSIDRETLGEIREQSSLLAPAVRDGDVMVRVTDAGETAVDPETGTVQAAGGDSHDELLLAAERAFAQAGWFVSVLEQNGQALPDARAYHPETQTLFTIEAETGNTNRPAGVLTNLRKAQEAEHIPLFVVPRKAGESLGHAAAIEDTLSTPVKRVEQDADTGTVRVGYYMATDPITFGGGASARGGVMAVRPRTEHRCTWWREGEEYVLRESDGTEHVRVTDIETAPRSAFPGLYTYDNEGNQHIVYTGKSGGPEEYRTKDALDDEWMPIQTPFIPTQDLPYPGYEADTYAIVVIQDPDNGEAVVYDDGGTYPLAELPDAGLHPARSRATSRHANAGRNGGDRASVASTDAQPDADTTDSETESIPETDKKQLVNEFIHAQIAIDPEAVTPKDDVFAAFKTWLRAEYPGVNVDAAFQQKDWFSKWLINYLGIDTKQARSADDPDERVWCYVGIRVQDGELI